MPTDPTAPILHRLGDIKLGDDVSITSDGVTFIATVDRYNDDASIDLRMNCGEMADYVTYPEHTPCTRLIPETPLTKHVGEMYRLMDDFATIRPEDCRPDAPSMYTMECQERRSRALRGMRALLSRIAAEGGA